MTESAADTDALICALRLDSGAVLGPDALEWAASNEAPLWLHFNLLDNRARRYLQQPGLLDEDAREMLLGNEPRIQAQAFTGGFAAVLGDLHHDFNVDPEGFGTLAVYVTDRRVVTCRRHRLRSIDRVRRELQANPGTHGPAGVFLLVLDEIANGFADVTSDLGERVEDSEDRILAGRAVQPSGDLGHIRRVLARLRRHGAANRSALGPLPHRAHASFTEDERAELLRLVERFEALGQDMELVSERARLVQEELASRVGEATNRNLYVLSIVTTALLPITLITGVFGMNVGGLPFAQSEHGFYWVMLGMTLVVVLTMLVLRRRRVP
jgi:zinc transporter